MNMMLIKACGCDGEPFSRGSRCCCSSCGSQAMNFTVAKIGGLSASSHLNEGLLNARFKLTTQMMVNALVKLLNDRRLAAGHVEKHSAMLR